MENKASTIEIDDSKRNLENVLTPLQNEVTQQEEKVRATIDELESKPAKRESAKVKEQGLSKQNGNGDMRRLERKRKQPAKLQESADSPNHLTYVGTIVEVL